MATVSQSAKKLSGQPVRDETLQADPRLSPRLGFVAGWNSPPLGPIAGALTFMALLCEADVCQLTWREEDGRMLVIDGARDAVIDSGTAAAGGWFEAVAGATPGSIIEAEEGIFVTPIFGPHGEAAGVFALRGQGDAATVDHLTEVGGSHLNLLLASANRHADRSTAYQALFEIGTQIQAQESHPERIFALIDERARELLRADAAWIAIGEPSTGHLHIEVTSGIRSPRFTQMESTIGIGIGGMAIKERRTIVIVDLDDYRREIPKEILDRLDEEGVVSIMCAPMLRGDDMLGALYVASRTRRHFSTEETHLISALAAQAAVTIKNSRLYEDLSERNQTLEDSFSIHRRLTEASLAGDGFRGVSAELARLVETDLLLTLVRGDSRHLVRRDEEAPADQLNDEFVGQLEDDASASLQIVAGEEELGKIHLLGEGEVTPLQHKALEHGATIIALELIKDRAALEVAWRLQGELLEELLASEGEIAESLLARAQRFGVDLTCERRLAILAPSAKTSLAALLEFTRRTAACRPSAQPLVAQRGDRVLIAVADEKPGEALEFIETLTSKGGRAGFTFRAGISNAGTDLSTALREATGALTLALRSPERATIIGYDDLGPLRFMLDAPDTSGMVSLVRQALLPLAEHDAVRNAELLPTLRNFLDTGGHQRSTADACHIHVSTLKYRLGKIADILGCDLHDPQTRFRLALALEVLTVLELAGVAPFEPKSRSADVPSAEVRSI